MLLKYYVATLSLSLISVSYSQQTDPWKLISTNFTISVDMENSYLFLRTIPSAPGYKFSGIDRSGDIADIVYWDEMNQKAGGISFRFQPQIEYKLLNCMQNYTPCPTSLQTDGKRMTRWVIEKRGHRTVVFARGMMILDVSVSSKTCDAPESTETWQFYWSRNVSTIKFEGGWDREEYGESNLYKISAEKPHCTGLMSNWKHFLVDEKFPVPMGTNLALRCPQGFYRTGDTDVRCEQDTQFYYTESNSPGCERPPTFTLTPSLDKGPIIWHTNRVLLHCKWGEDGSSGGDIHVYRNETDRLSPVPLRKSYVDQFKREGIFNKTIRVQLDPMYRDYVALQSRKSKAYYEIYDDPNQPNEELFFELNNVTKEDARTFVCITPRRGRSVEITLDILEPPTGSVKNLNVKANATEVMVSWSAVPEATFYNVEYHNPDKPNILQEVRAENPNVTISGLRPTTKYLVRVTAMNKAGSRPGVPPGEITFQTTERAPCKAGYFMTEEGCKQCEENTFSGPGASSCTSCPTGKLSPAGSISVQDCQYAPCEAGSYMTETGCEECGENTYSGPGASNCTSCPKGMVSLAGSTSVQSCLFAPCKSGYFMTETGCEQCEENTYSGPAAYTCTSCPNGMVSPSGSTSIESCLFAPCKSGYFMTDTGCEECGENTYSGPAAYTCTGCPVGKVSSAGSTSLQDCQYAPCKAGYYMTNTGCKQCTVNTYSGDEATNCTSCPERKTSPAGSVSVDNCEFAPCKAGSYMTETGCKQCEENTFSEDGASSCTSCPKYTGSSAGSQSQYDCKERKRKPGELIPVSTDSSESTDESTSDLATDLDLTTETSIGPDSDGNSWLILKLDMIHCITSVIDFDSDGAAFIDWTCTESGCSTCDDNDRDLCKYTSVTVYIPEDEEDQKSLPSRSNCKFGNTVKYLSHKENFRINVLEIGIIGDRGKGLCKGGEYITEIGCKQCGANAYSVFGANTCTNCPENTVSDPGSASLEDCRERFRKRRDGEITPVSTASSESAETSTSDLATDLDLTTQTDIGPDSEGNTWLEIKLDKVHCVREIDVFDSDGSASITWNCTDTDCSSCDDKGNGLCRRYSVSVIEEDKNSGPRYSYPDCKYGNIVKYVSQGQRRINVYEIMIVEGVCGAGYYRTMTTEYLSCERCEENTFSEYGAISCSRCPVGMVSPRSSTSYYDCRFAPCKAGSYMTESGCKLCGENTYSGDGASSCTDCPEDTGSAAGSKSIRECKAPCKAGYYMTDTGCRLCEQDTFSGDGASSCTDCPEYTGSAAGSKSRKECKVRKRKPDEIVPESVETSGIGGSEELNDIAHAIDLDLRTKTKVKLDSKGSAWLKLNLDLIYCIKSVVSFDYNGSVVITWTCTETDCSTCETADSKHRAMCDVFSLIVSNVGGGTEKLPTKNDCKYGEIVEIRDMRSPSNPDKDKGFIVNEMAILGYEHLGFCKAGHHSTETGCKQCGENTFSAPGAPNCTSCPVDKISLAGSTSVQNCTFAPCKAGYYMTESGCEQCEENTFSKDGATSCTKCPGKEVSPAGSISVFNCTYAPCKAGSYMTKYGCKQCKENTYSADGATNCTSCPTGKLSLVEYDYFTTLHFSNLTSLQNCKFDPCEAGYYMTKVGCQQCVNNTYSGPGADSCTKCPDDRVSKPGSTSVQDCKHAPCKAGYHMTDTGCKQCKEDTFSGDGASSCTSCPEGEVSKAGSTSIFDCVRVKNDAEEKRPKYNIDGDQSPRRRPEKTQERRMEYFDWDRYLELTSVDPYKHIRDIIEKEKAEKLKGKFGGKENVIVEVIEDLVDEKVRSGKVKKRNIEDNEENCWGLKILGWKICL